MSEELMDVAARHLDLDPPADSAAETTVDGLDPVELEQDPFDDDLESTLRARAPLPVTRTTVLLAGLVLVVAGFLGGVLVQKNFGAASSNSANGNLSPSALASRAAAGGFGGFGGGGRGGTGTGTGGTGTAGTGTARAATTGKVTLVDGTTVYVTTDSGDVVIIKTDANTTVRSEQTLPLKNLTVGSTVTVVGTTASDGSVTATQITQQK